MGKLSRKKHPRRHLELVELAPTPDHLRLMSLGAIEPGARFFRLGGCSVIVGRGPTGWHLSIANPGRYPTWDEMHEARYRLLPGDVTMAMLLPPKSQYINVHKNCFHLYETETEAEYR